jgi:hypothetical protein
MVEYTNGSVIGYEIDNGQNWIVIDKEHVQRSLLGWATVWINDPDLVDEEFVGDTLPPCTGLVPAVFGSNGTLQVFDHDEMYILQLVSKEEWKALILEGRRITFVEGRSDGTGQD